MFSLLGLAAAPSHATVTWKKAMLGCEPPGVFYSNKHRAGAVPCCATQAGVCPGGAACPVTGVCPGSSTKCVPQAVTRPNVVLFISDDQGYCFYGHAGECRSTQSGTPIFAPETPNLDRLAGYGTVFPVAHNTAAWCYPALNTILTGRFQKSFGGSRTRIGERFNTIPRALKNLGNAPGTVVDPFDGEAAIGGYCSYLAGKFTALAGEPGFDAGVRGTGHRLGRLPCDAGVDTPECGTERASSYDPRTLDQVSDVLSFVDSMLYRVPGTASTYTTQPFFVWYAPRLPHQPLDAPPAVEDYLFGGSQHGMGGLFDLGGLCTGGACPPVVRAFDESNFGNVREYYANVWRMDDNVREIRKFLSKASQPHCIGPDGVGRYQVATPGACSGGATWATSIQPGFDRNTVLLYLSDNGWQLPNSKHNFSENGYRTRLMVFDPRTQTDGVEYRASTTPPVPYESPAVAHSTDILPTVLGYALNTPGRQACPKSDDGTACDGRDLRPQLIANPGGPAPAADLRHALCGHQTQRGTIPSRQRYLLTRPDSVGRCIASTLPACTTDANCASGRSCIAGRCMATNAPACATSANCPAGSACVGGQCQAAPVCLNDATCARLMPGQAVTCSAKGTKWCRNAPTKTCGSRADCPSCPVVNGRELPCGRVCEPHLLKMYVSMNGVSAQLEDLFTDPDENQRHTGKNSESLRAMSDLAGPYGPDIRSMACCLDTWWAEGSRGGTLCTGGATCPADLACNQ